MVDYTAPLTGFTQYIFGNELLAAIGFLIIVTIIGVKYEWGVEPFIMVYLPTFSFLASVGLGLGGLYQIALVGIGVAVGIMYIVLKGR